MNCSSKHLFLLLFLTIFVKGAAAQCGSFISTFPYSESFETTASGWTSGGLNNDWVRGTPSKPVINSAYDGNSCWITGTASGSFYNYGERSYVESPCFDFTNLQRPFISVWIFWDTEYQYDGSNLQYSLDGGTVWTTAGSFFDPPTCGTQNWYNISSITNLANFISGPAGWAGNSQSSSGSCRGGNGSRMWKNATHCFSIFAGQPLVKFRFTFGTGTTCNDYDGFAFDLFSISEAPSYPAYIVPQCNTVGSYLFADTSAACKNNWQWFFGDGEVGAGNPITHQYTSAGDYTVTLIASGSCASDTTVTYNLRSINGQVNTTDVTCDGDSNGTATVTLFNAGPDTYYLWPDNNVSTSNVYNGLSTGDYSVTIIDSSTCDFSLNFSVRYGPFAFPKVSLGKDTIICPGVPYKLKLKNYSQYLWNTGSTDSVVTINDEGTYSVQVKNTAGCTANDSIEITADCLNEILIPNSFTPNGDGKNDFFFVSGSQTDEFVIYIYNRWGELVFSSEDRNFTWNGQLDEREVQIEIYAYKIVYKVNGSKERFKTGSITVYR